MNARGALGRYGEDLAVRTLRTTGMQVLERNWRCAHGEIDIVAHRQGRARRLRGEDPPHRSATSIPMAAVPPAKAARLRRLASRWLTERWLARYGRPPAGGVRIDLVGVLLPGRGAPVVQHAKGVA